MLAIVEISNTSEMFILSCGDNDASKQLGKWLLPRKRNQCGNIVEPHLKRRMKRNNIAVQNSIQDHYVIYFMEISYE